MLFHSTNPRNCSETYILAPDLSLQHLQHRLSLVGITMAALQLLKGSWEHQTLKGESPRIVDVHADPNISLTHCPQLQDHLALRSPGSTQIPLGKYLLSFSVLFHVFPLLPHCLLTWEAPCQVPKAAFFPPLLHACTCCRLRRGCRLGVSGNCSPSPAQQMAVPSFQCCRPSPESHS